MRPREREETTSPLPPSPPPTEEAPLSSAAAAPRIGGGLSSMVVRPSDNGGGSGESDDEASEGHVAGRREKSPSSLRRRNSPPSGPRRRGSTPDVRRRGSPQVFRRRDSPPPAFRRRYSPPGFHPRSHGYGMRAGSISPSRRRRLDDDHYDPDFDHPVRPSFGRGSRGGRGKGRFRDISQPYGPGRGGSGRGYNVSGRRLSPVEGEYVHRNDPNLSPREGDWICQNPSCGNLNFARRTYCNNCNEYRIGPGRHAFSRSPQRGYFNSSPLQSPPRFSGLPVERGLRRDMNGYRSPPRRWAAEDSRGFISDSPPLRRGGRFADDIRRERPDYREEHDYGERRKFDWPRRGEWNPRDQVGDGFIPNRRGFDRRSPSPRGRWVRDSRERSRSPMGDKSLSYMGRGRGNQQRYDDPYISRERIDDSNIGRGRGYRHRDDSLIGQGRGDRRGMARGSNGILY